MLITPKNNCEINKRAQQLCAQVISACANKCRLPGQKIEAMNADEAEEE
jgi:hypothetical protein